MQQFFDRNNDYKITIRQAPERKRRKEMLKTKRIQTAEKEQKEARWFKSWEEMRMMVAD